MYQFSRSIYRELAPHVREYEGAEDYAAAKLHLLEACEQTIDRLVSDRRYFARPVKTLFSDVRGHFPLGEQVRVHMVIQRHIDAAVEYIDSLPDELRPRQCPASTRQGTLCRRDPRPGREYCPSHRHLEESLSLDGVAVAA